MFFLVMLSLRNAIIACVIFLAKWFRSYKTRHIVHNSDSTTPCMHGDSGRSQRIYSAHHINLVPTWRRAC